MIASGDFIRIGEKPHPTPTPVHTLFPQHYVVKLPGLWPEPVSCLLYPTCTFRTVSPNTFLFCH